MLACWRARALVLRVRVVGALHGPHAALAPALLQVLGVHLHGRVALQRPTPAGPLLPKLLVLHLMTKDARKARAGSGSAAGSAADRAEQAASGSLAAAMAGLSSDALRVLAAQWLAAQAAAGGRAGAGDGADVLVQDGSIISLSRVSNRGASEEALSLRVEMVPGAGAAKPAQCLLAAKRVRCGEVRVELGDPVPLPASQPAGHGRQAKLPCAACFGERWLEQYAWPALLRLAPLLHGPARAALAELQSPPPGGLLICGNAGRWVHAAMRGRMCSLAVLGCKHKFYCGDLVCICCQATRCWGSARHAVSERLSCCGASGKSGLAALVADTLATDRHCYAHIVWVACEGIPVEPLSQAQQKLVPLVRPLAAS